jgi:hypothetical protein
MRCHGSPDHAHTRGWSSKHLENQATGAVVAAIRIVDAHVVFCGKNGAGHVLVTGPLL